LSHHVGNSPYPIYCLLMSFTLMYIQHQHRTPVRYVVSVTVTLNDCHMITTYILYIR